MLTLENTELITLPDAPAIPGLIFRRFQGESDFPRMHAVIHGCKEADQSERSDTVEDIRRNYSHMVNSDPQRDMLFAEINGEVVGYSRVNWRTEPDGKRIYQHFGFLLPGCRRKGIGRAMLRYNQAHIRQLATTQTNHAPHVFESFAGDTEQSATALLLSEKYLAVRHFYEMVRHDLENIPEAPMPQGLEVRPADPEQFQVIIDASKEAFRDHWGFSEDEEPTVAQIAEDPNTDPSLWRVAWAGDEVAGMVLSFIDQNQNAEYNRLRGWTENICVRRPWRRLGLARSLLMQSLHAIKERGMREAALGVDTENLSGALRLYESVGFRPVKRFTTYHKPF